MKESGKRRRRAEPAPRLGGGCGDNDIGRQRERRGEGEIRSGGGAREELEGYRVDAALVGGVPQDLAQPCRQHPFLDHFPLPRPAQVRVRTLRNLQLGLELDRCPGRDDGRKAADAGDLPPFIGHEKRNGFLLHDHAAGVQHEVQSILRRGEAGRQGDRALLVQGRRGAAVPEAFPRGAGEGYVDLRVAVFRRVLRGDREGDRLSIREDLPVSGGGDLQVCRIRLGRHEEILVPARDEEREKGEDEGAPGLTVGHSHQIYHPGG